MCRCGRYNNVSEVVRSALRLLLKTEPRRSEFNLMLREAEEESDHNGSISVESVLAEMDQIIATDKY
jgi:antitoxin ParD1/3/4